jgi:predicted KAP-like P-loop ATPase
MKETDIDKRGQILKEAINATMGVYLPISQTSWAEYSYEKPESAVPPLVTLEAVSELKGICINKIRDTSKSDILRKNPHMLSVLYHWRKWSSPEESQKWVEELVQSKEGLLSFLTGCLLSSASHAMGDHVERIRWRISLRNIEDFILPDIIADKISSLKTDELTEREQKAVRAFQKALKRRQEGKPDDNWNDEEE